MAIKKIVMVEISSSLRRGEVSTIKRKKEFYEKKKNVKVDRVIIVTPYVNDKYPDNVIAMANSMGIDIITSISELKR